MSDEGPADWFHFCPPARLHHAGRVCSAIHSSNVGLGARARQLFARFGAAPAHLCALLHRGIAIPDSLAIVRTRAADFGARPAGVLVIRRLAVQDAVAHADLPPIFIPC